MSEERPKSVLFVCNQNAIRSPMAAACLQHLAKGRMFVSSAGLITGLADSFTKTVLDEKNIRLGDHQPKSLNRIDASEFSLIIALTNKSHERLISDGLDDQTTVEFWDVTDPTQIEGRRDQVLDSYRIVRDDLNRRVHERFAYLLPG